MYIYSFYNFVLLIFFQDSNLENQLNVMLFSDHGMTKIKWMEKVIELDKYIDMSDIVKMMDRGPVVSLWPKNTTYQKVTLCHFFF